jgi:hypothetical protein
MTAIEDARTALAKLESVALGDALSARALRDLIAEHERLTAPPTDDEREAQRGTPEDPQDSLARVIWESSRDDEGTISATGANIVARAVIAAGFRRQGPTTDEWEYGVLGPTGRMVNNGDYTHLQTHRRRKAGPWESVEAARDA